MSTPMIPGGSYVDEEGAMYEVLALDPVNPANFGALLSVVSTPTKRAVNKTRSTLCDEARTADDGKGFQFRLTGTQSWMQWSPTTYKYTALSA